MQILNTGEPAQRQWLPVQTSGGAITLYEGQLITMGTDGANALGAASGAFNQSTVTGSFPAWYVPFGIVLGTSNRYEQFSSTYNAQYITSIITSNANLYPAGREMIGLEGGWGMDSQAYVYVERIFPWTIIRSPIYFSTIGTAPTVATVASGASSTGMGYTTAASVGFTPIASQSMAYCRSGLNRGISRITSDTSTTVRTVTSPFPFAISVGDTFVHVNFRPIGLTPIQFDSLSLAVLGNAALSSDYYAVDVVRVNLEEAGREYVDFRFSLINFLPNLDPVG